MGLRYMILELDLNVPVDESMVECVKLSRLATLSVGRLFARQFALKPE